MEKIMHYLLSPNYNLVWVNATLEFKEDVYFKHSTIKKHNIKYRLWVKYIGNLRGWETYIILTKY